MPEIKDVYQEAGSIWHEAKAIMDQYDGKAMPQDVTNQVNEILNRFDQKQASAQVLERYAASQKWVNSIPDSSRLPIDGKSGGSRTSGDDRIDQAIYTKAFRDFLARGENGMSHENKALLLEGYEKKAALNEGTAGQGGYLTPTLYSDQLITALNEMSIFRKAGARVVPINSDDVRFTTVVNGARAVIQSSEAGAVSEIEPTFGEVAFTPFTYTRLAKASLQVARDSRFDLWNNILKDEYDQAFAAAENEDFAVGDGSAAPQGITVGGGNGLTVAGTTTITADELHTFYHSLNHLYREHPSCAWMMQDNTLLGIRKLKDGENRYLWQPALAAGEPNTLMGKPLYLNPSMPAFTTGLKPIALGAFYYYIIGERQQLEIEVLDQLYKGNLQMGYLAHKRLDGNVALAAAFKYVTAA